VNIRGLRAFVLVPLLLAALLSGGCGRLATMLFCGHEMPDGIVAGDLVGTYRGEEGATVWLDETEFAIADLPERDWETGEDALTSGDGTWSLQPAPDDEFTVDLNFAVQTEPELSPNLYIAGSRDEPMLWYYIGDADACRMHELKLER